MKRRQHPEYLIEELRPVAPEDLLPADHSHASLIVFPFHRMKVGHSFLVEDHRVWKSARSRASKYSIDSGKLFLASREPRGLRITRHA
jgi:hypothetical protein